MYKYTRSKYFDPLICSPKSSSFGCCLRYWLAYCFQVIIIGHTWSKWLAGLRKTHANDTSYTFIPNPRNSVFGNLEFEYWVTCPSWSISNARVVERHSLSTIPYPPRAPHKYDQIWILWLRVLVWCLDFNLWGPPCRPASSAWSKASEGTGGGQLPHSLSHYSRTCHNLVVETGGVHSVNSVETIPQEAKL